MCYQSVSTIPVYLYQFGNEMEGKVRWECATLHLRFLPRPELAYISPMKLKINRLAIKYQKYASKINLIKF